MLQLCFHNTTKHETNSKAKIRRQFEKFLASSNSSFLQVFNEIVLRIEKLSIIAIPDLQTERVKISYLMSTLDKTPWFMLETTGVDYLKDFSDVVHKVSHGLSKITLHDP